MTPTREMENVLYANLILQTITVGCVSSSLSKGIGFLCGRLVTNCVQYSWNAYFHRSAEENDMVDLDSSRDLERKMLSNCQRISGIALIFIETFALDMFYELIPHIFWQGVVTQTHLIVLLSTVYHKRDQSSPEEQKIEFVQSCAFLVTSVTLTILMGGYPVLSNGVGFLASYVVKEFCFSREAALE